MENFMTFDTSQLLLFLASLPIMTMIFVFVKKYLIRRIRHNFDFNKGHYLLGLAISLGTSIALINWETYDEPFEYFVEDVPIETSIVHIPRTFQKQIKKVVPPPPKPKKTIKAIDLTKLKLVKDDLVESKEEPLVDEADIPAPIVIPTAVSAPPPMPEPIVEKKENDFILVAEQMPRFPGCEDSDEGMDEKEACSKQKLLKYMYKHLKYPAQARQNGIEGLVVLQFVVSKQGRIENLKIVREIGGGCGAAAAKVVSAMNDMLEPWTAGKQRGRPVKVLYTLPVKFQLN